MVCKTKNEPNVNCGLWVMIMCPCRFINCASDEGVTVGGDCDCVCVGGCLGPGGLRRNH